MVEPYNLKRMFVSSSQSKLA